MESRQFVDALRNVLTKTKETSSDLNQNTIRSIETFEEAGMLTHDEGLDEGLVVSLTDGSEFQLTIVQSRNARA